MNWVLAACFSPAGPSGSCTLLLSGSCTRTLHCTAPCTLQWIFLICWKKKNLTNIFATGICLKQLWVLKRSSAHLRCTQSARWRLPAVFRVSRLLESPIASYCCCYVTKGHSTGVKYTARSKKACKCVSETPHNAMKCVLNQISMLKWVKIFTFA